jgi:hypothetical protein
MAAHVGRGEPGNGKDDPGHPGGASSWMPVTNAVGERLLEWRA